MIAAACYHAGYKAGQTAAVVPCLTMCTSHANQRIDALLAKLATRERREPDAYADPCTTSPSD
jgi:hypothetical protein